MDDVEEVRIKDAAGDAVAILRVGVFNRESSSDLVVVVHDHRYYLHRAVMLPLSGYLQRFGQWQKTEGDAEIRLRLPDTEPSGLRSGIRPLTDAFLPYLELIYGIYSCPSAAADRIAQLVGVVQIADFMLSPAVLPICDDLLCADNLHSNDNAVDFVIIAQRYRLPKAGRAAIRFIAQQALSCGLMVGISKEIRDMQFRLWDLQISLGEVVTLMTFPDDPSLRPDMDVMGYCRTGYLFADLFARFSWKWDRRILGMVFDRLESSRKLMMEGVRLELYHLIAWRYRQLDQVEEAAAKARTGERP